MSEINKNVSKENLEQFTRLLNRKIVGQVTSLQQDITKNTSSIEAEKTRATTSEASLDSKINKEISDRSKDISDIQSSISSLDTTLRQYTDGKLEGATSGIELQVNSHITNKSNPHDVTPQQIGAVDTATFNELKESVDNLDNLTDTVRRIETELDTKVSKNSTSTQNIYSNIFIGKDNSKGIRGDLTVEGNLYVHGSQTTVDTETLAVKDNFIFVNSDGEKLGNSVLAGIAIRTDSTNAYGIAYDPLNDSVSLGEGRISNSQFTFNSNERKPILTRDVSSSMKDGALLVWNSDTNSVSTTTLPVEDEIRNQLETNFTSIHEHNKLAGNVSTHILDFNNPHQVTWSHVSGDAFKNSVTPSMNGTATAGQSSDAARADHIHPTDTSRAPTDHSSASTLYGKATASKYGHVIVDTSMSSTSENTIQNKVVKEYIDSVLDSDLTLSPDETIKSIKQENGKIKIEKQSLAVDMDSIAGFGDQLANLQKSVTTLTNDLNDEKSIRTSSDEQLSISISNVRSDLTDMINSVGNDVSVLESTVESVRDMNVSIQTIQDQISSGIYNHDQLWVLSFNVATDAYGNNSYIPYFTLIDDGELS